MVALKTYIARVRLFYDPTREPLRRRVYTTLLLVVPFAVTAGILTGSAATGLIGLLPVLLAVPAVEKARSLVTPVADPDLTDAPGKHAADRS
jgi:hypothetical protein